MDADDAIKFSNEAYERLGYNRKALPPTLKVVHLVGWLDFEVSLGGVLGWLSNMGEYGPDTVIALDAIEAHQCAALVREMLAFFPEGTPASDSQARARQIEDIFDTAESSWSDLGDSLLAWPDDIHVLLQKFIAEHEADFT